MRPVRPSHSSTPPGKTQRPAIRCLDNPSLGRDGAIIPLLGHRDEQFPCHVRSVAHPVSPTAAAADRLSGQIVRKVTMCLPRLTIQSILRTLCRKRCRATAAGTGIVSSRSLATWAICGNVSTLARVLRHRFIVTRRISPYVGVGLKRFYSPGHSSTLTKTTSLKASHSTISPR